MVYSISFDTGLSKSRAYTTTTIGSVIRDVMEYLPVVETAYIQCFKQDGKVINFTVSKHNDHFNINVQYDYTNINNQRTEINKVKTRLNRMLHIAAACKK